MTKTINYQRKLTKLIKSLDIAGYLRNEVFDVFQHMNYYKMRNLWSHKDDFFDYLVLLDQENTRLISQLLDDENHHTDTSDYSTLSFYLSIDAMAQLANKGKNIVDTTKPHIEKPLWQIINSLKAMLLFTISEYLHASHLRMHIETPIRQKER